MEPFSNFAISFTIISVLAGCFTTYGQAFNNGGPIAISWGWPIICALILTVAFSMSELCSAYPTAGGPYWWAAKLGGPGWSWFTGWFNVIGLIAVVASVDYACATFAANLFSLWDLNILVNFTGTPELDEIFVLFLIIMALHALINIYSAHLVALFNNISVGVHVVGVAIIILILIIVPDRHQSADFVFTDTINNSGFSDGSGSNLFFWFYVLPVGFLLTMYTVTGYDASAHVSEETKDAEVAAAKGVWQSVFFSAVIGWFVLLAITFAAVDMEAAAGGAIPIFTSAMSSGWAEIVILISTIGQFFCGMACVTSCSRTFYAFSRDRAVPGWQIWSSVNQQSRSRGRRAGLLCVGRAHHTARPERHRRHPGGVLRGRLDRRDRPLHRLRDAGVPAPQGRRLLRARVLDARREVQVGQHDRRGLGDHLRGHLLAAVHPGRGVLERRVHLVVGQLLAADGAGRDRCGGHLVARQREEHLQGPGREPSASTRAWESPRRRKSRRRRREQPPQLGEHWRRALEDVAIGVTAELVAASVSLPFTAAVLLPGVARAVVAVAVELDGEVEVGPTAVDPAAARHAIRPRKREARRLAAG